MSSKNYSCPWVALPDLTDISVDNVIFLVIPLSLWSTWTLPSTITLTTYQSPSLFCFYLGIFSIHLSINELPPSFRNIFIVCFTVATFSQSYLTHLPSDSSYTSVPDWLPDTLSLMYHITALLNNQIKSLWWFISCYLKSKVQANLPISNFVILLLLWCPVLTDMYASSLLGISWVFPSLQSFQSFQYAIYTLISHTHFCHYFLPVPFRCIWSLHFWILLKFALWFLHSTLNYSYLYVCYLVVFYLVSCMFCTCVPNLHIIHMEIYLARNKFPQEGDDRK